MKYTVAALYKFVLLENFEAMREPILDFCKARDVKGTLLLAREGINGTVAGNESAIQEVLAYLRSLPGL